MPAVTSYKASSGVWHKVQPVSLVCAGGLLCDYLTQDQLDSRLGSYTTVDALTYAMDSLHQQASATYLPKTGGTVQTLAVTTSFSPPSIAFDDLPRPCTPPLIAYVPDGQKFWTAMTADHNAGSSYIYKDTNPTNASTYVGCLLVNGTPSWVPLLINSQAGKW
ncbi:hypothetical protein [Asaia prunellae]|uniref:hypothetical protein n=1 Tax=Asaia prunellae TaxID=610245 RepID=UPI00047239F8|nr:hypothetical protein [Asaia prunellae]